VLLFILSLRERGKTATGRIGSTFAELLIDCEEDRTLRAVLVAATRLNLPSLLADEERMALPRQDPRPPRMPAWAFAVLVAWLAFIAYFIVVTHARWGLLAYLLTLAALLVVRKRRAQPTRVEQSLRRLDESPRVWAAMGWGTLALGAIMVVLIGRGLAFALSSRDYEHLWGKVFGFAISLGVVVVGRWLTRDRRPPFKPATRR
jgi:hypothetical protein